MKAPSNSRRPFGFFLTFTAFIQLISQAQARQTLRAAFETTSDEFL